MRKGTIAAAALAGAVALTVGTPMAADASTSKGRLRVCWKSPAGTHYGQKFAADGAVSRASVLASGHCATWNRIPVGDYKVAWSNANQLFLTFFDTPGGHEAVCGPDPQNASWEFIDLAAIVKRSKNNYETEEVGNDGTMRVTVQKGHLTSINFRVFCHAF